jgi:hypothetical protein
MFTLILKGSLDLHGQRNVYLRLPRTSPGDTLHGVVALRDEFLQVLVHFAILDHRAESLVTITILQATVHVPAAK